MVMNGDYSEDFAVNHCKSIVGIFSGIASLLKMTSLFEVC